jgi:cobalt-zinc-cadmium efflux system protein
MSHDHHHHHHPPAGSVSRRRMGLAVALTLIFVIGEAVAGFLSHSLALLSDAGHNFADALALILSWYALWIAHRPSNAKQTFGYHRVGILAALVNAVSLVVIALLIGWEALGRLRAPAPVAGDLMIWVALGAIVVNVTIALWLRSGAKHDLNLRGAYLHMVGDAVSAMGVVVAGVVIVLTGLTSADMVVSLLIAGLILWSSWGILVESVNILMDGTPAGLDMAGLTKRMAEVAGVLGVHDLHVWTVGSGLAALSCHVLIAEQSVRSGEKVLRALAEMLEHDFNIRHTTIQIEVEGCDPNDLFCTMHPTSQSHAHHQH